METGVEHTQFVCTCNRQGCMFCDGGLFRCQVCDSFEGATTSECPGRTLSYEELDTVYRGFLDFKDGMFVESASPHSPAYYRK